MTRKQLSNARVLIVDDQPNIHDDFKEMLLTPGAAADDVAASFLSEEPDHLLPEFELLHATGGREACELVARAARDERPIAVAYIDIRMPPGIDGVTTVREIRRVDRAIEIVLMTAYTEMSLADIVQDMELLHKLLYLRKPCAREEVQQITLALVQKWNLERELEARRRQLALANGRLTAVLDSIDEAIAVSDDAHGLLFANRCYQRLMAATESEMKAMTLPEANALWNARLRRIPLTDAGRRLTSEAGGELVEPRDDDPREAAGGAPGRLFYRQHRPVHDDRGAVIGNLYVYRDLSSEVEVERMKAEMLSLRSAREGRSSFAGIVGTSAAMQRVYALMERAMETDAMVLIRGESGTGKELAAKALHANGPRRTGPFLTVNCAAVPEDMIESELFGHEPGAFAGATQARAGCFERAHGGTLLLEETADLKPDVQTKLLRVLQEREVQRVGGTDTIPADVQAIVATTCDLEATMRPGSFREDLYCLLTVFPIVLPPLRERREDIPLLVDQCLRQHAECHGEPVKGVHSRTMRRLLAYDWPGNVRELRGVMERAALLETGDTIRAVRLPADLQAARRERATEHAVAPLALVERRPRLRALDAVDHHVTSRAGSGSQSRDAARQAEGVPAAPRRSRRWLRRLLRRVNPKTGARSPAPSDQATRHRPRRNAA